MSISLVLADDQPLILYALTGIFSSEEDMEVLACCTDGIQALEAVRAHRPDVVLLDITMPRMSGLEVSRKIREDRIPTRIVLLTAVLEEEQLLEALHLRIDGFLLKELATNLVVQCVRKVQTGECWLEMRSARKALDKFLLKEEGLHELASSLTYREIDLARMVARGLSNQEIAHQLFISEGTVKVHLHNIYSKLRFTTRRELLQYARDKGLV